VNEVLSHTDPPLEDTIELLNTGSVASIVQRLQAYAAAHPGEEWLVGRGWMPSDFPGLTAHRRYLDAAFPDRPVVIRDRDGHQALANSRALVLAGVTAATPDPEDGRIERDADGRPTGLLKERAARLVLERLPPMTVEATYALLLEEMDSAASVGLTSLQDATAGGFTEIEQAREPGQKMIFTPEVQADLLGLRKKEAGLDKTLRDLRRQLRRDVDNLQAGIKWINILGMPALVIAIGGVVLLFRRRRVAAH